MQNSLLEVQKKLLPKNLSLKKSSGHIDFRFESPVEKLLPVIGKIVTQIPPKTWDFNSFRENLHLNFVLYTLKQFWQPNSKIRQKSEIFSLKVQKQGKKFKKFNSNSFD